MAKPKPIRATAVRCQDIIVRSRLKRVRTQAKWLSAVTLTSNLLALEAACESVMPAPFLITDVPRSETRHGRARCPPVPDGALPAGSGGSNSARTDANRLSEPC